MRDGKGQFASDLREQGFAVYEEGVRQTIELFQHEDIPVTAYFPGRINEAIAICERNAPRDSPLHSRIRFQQCQESGCLPIDPGGSRVGPGMARWRCTHATAASLLRP